MKERCAQIDWVKVISNDLVVLFTDHYKKVGEATFVFLLKSNFFLIYLFYWYFNRSVSNGCPFQLHSYLETDEAEDDFLRALSEALILVALPSSYSSTLALRHLLREVFVFKGNS